ncbi:hypothetical protein ACFXG6_25115 [Streptomyces roseus]|uniref:hypothetical protein n=1 Tax=Streptomyces roseus TaxID=66430 RepID=UPI0036BEC68F
MNGQDSPRRDREGQSAEKEFPAHPLVAKLQEQGRDTNGLAVFVGFIGKIPDAGRVRVRYCELDVHDIAGTAQVDPADENSPTIVCVVGTSHVRLVEQAVGEATYISGSIAGRYLARALNLADREQTGGMQRDTVRTSWSCPVRTLEGACETRNPFCPTHTLM